jgi:hypothetical protein
LEHFDDKSKAGNFPTKQSSSKNEINVIETNPATEKERLRIIKILIGTIFVRRNLIFTVNKNGEDELDERQFNLIIEDMRHVV